MSPERDTGRVLADEGGWEYDVEVTVWETESFARWAFVTLPPEVTDDIDDRTARLPQRGFGAVRVEVAVGATVWRTSVFPDARRGGLVLPLKKAVRTAEGIAVGDTVRLALRVVDA